MKSHYHCVYKLTYHLVLVTKYRKTCFTDEILNRLKEIVTDLCQKWKVELLAFYGEPVLWTRGYCLLTTGDATTHAIRQYIEKQERPD